MLLGLWKYLRLICNAVFMWYDYKLLNSAGERPIRFVEHFLTALHCVSR